MSKLVAAAAAAGVAVCLLTTQTGEARAQSPSSPELSVTPVVEQPLPPAAPPSAKGETTGATALPPLEVDADQKKKNRKTAKARPSSGTGAASAMQAVPAKPSGAIANADPTTAPYSTAAPTSYVAGETIERFRGSSPADMFRGTPGVMSGQARNGAGSIDVNVRGMQGLGRVSVKVDDTENQVTVSQGYQGISNRSFVDPDLLAGIDITKGSDAASSGIAGTVAMRTLDAKDIVKPGNTFGFRAKGGLGGNTATPEPGSKAGYAIRNNIGWDDPTSGYPTVTQSSTGMDRPDFLDPTQRSGSVVGAAKNDYVDLLAAFARRKQGNYFAGTDGRSAEPVSTGPRPFCYPDGSCPFIYRDYMINGGLTNYRAGEEVLNTQLDTKSWLLKGTLHLSEGQSLKLIHNGYRSEAGDQIASAFATNVSQATQQAQTTGINLDSDTLQYRWNPAGDPLVNLKANLWRTQLEQRNPIRIKNWGSTPAMYGLPDDFRVGSNTQIWGADVSNVSKFHTSIGAFKYDYGASYKNEDTEPSAYTNLVDLTSLRDGKREEAAGYGKLSWNATSWLTLNSGLRYQHYSATDRSEPKDQPVDDAHGQSVTGGGFSPSVGVTLVPINGAQLYVNYSSALRSPSIMETITGFSTMFNADLKAERSNNWEIGANLIADDLLLRDDKGMVKIGYFDWTVNDYIARQFTTLTINGYTANTMLVYNIDEAHFSGWEFSGRYTVGGFTADLAANYYTDVTFCKTAGTCGTRTLYADYATNQVPPKYTVDLTLSHKLFNEALTVGGRVSYVGARAAGHGEVTAAGLSQFIALTNWEPFMLIDTFAEYKISESLTAELHVNNLTDVYYVDPLSLVQQPAPGRTFYTSLTAHF